METRDILRDLLERILRDNYPQEEKDEESWNGDGDRVDQWMERVREMSQARLLALIRVVNHIGKYEPEMVDAAVELGCAD